ncbi:hypothetical protein H6F86_16160 [Phormidium sp. FACHB-592]|uniref:Uncharacterized protein n=1 Tax=Stenomitos frigidus AS-A4 TaxID=2933935 RepID=A0ABV0KSJ8_9CYAN|nr:hypothetical protein [Phormidium sp. FACHB-592]MBD2075402.1 hypothetical protein [Phormidium sp. FACHB-592]
MALKLLYTVVNATVLDRSGGRTTRVGTHREATTNSTSLSLHLEHYPDFLAGLVKQSTSLNLEALVEAAPAERRSRVTNPIDSVAGVLDQQTLIDVLEAMQPLSVAHAENVGDWSVAIVSYLQQHPSISLVEVQQTLKMPLVELWIGALLSGQVNWSSAATSIKLILFG